MRKKNIKRKIIKLFRHPVQVFRNRTKKLFKKENNKSSKPKVQNKPTKPISIQNVQNIKENILLYTITGKVEKNTIKKKFLYI